MPHVPRTVIHAYRLRARLLSFAVTTETTPTDITFEMRNTAGTTVLTKTGLASVAAAGVRTTDLDLTDTDLTVAAGNYVWELRYTVSGEPYTVALGWCKVDPEPTPIA